jgi:hypothetical protein
MSDRKRGRPKVLRVTLPLTAYGDMGRRERENFRRHVADNLNYTDAAAEANYWRVKTASLALEPYGITLVPNDRVLHIHQEWPHQARRKVSGSVWDGRKPIWRAPTIRDYPHKLGKLTNGPKIKCAHRSWKSAEQLTAAARAPVTPRGDDPAAAHALLTAIGHLAAPATKRVRAFLDGEVNKEIMAKCAHVYEPLTWWQRAKYWQGALPCPEWLLNKVGGFVTKIPRCTGAYSLTEWPLDYIAAPVFAEELGGGDAWWANIAGTQHEDVGDDIVQAPEVLGEIHRCGIDQLQFPKISAGLTVADITQLVWWAKINRRRAQMQLKFPPASETGPARVLNARVVTGRSGLAECGWRGAGCCRWTPTSSPVRSAPKKKTCSLSSTPKKTCPLACWRRQK